MLTTAESHAAATGPRTTRELRIGIAGLGAIGKALAARLEQGRVPGSHLSAVVVRDAVSSQSALATLSRKVQVVSFEDLPQVADVIVECAPARFLPDIAVPALTHGRTLIVLSAAGLLEHPNLIELAKRHGGQIIVPTGALIGLDAVNAAAEGEIRSVKMITRKPVKGLLGAPFFAEHNLDISRITAPMRVFLGTAREAAKGFPANLNVAVALSLAGIGPDRTLLEIWADPHLERNTHSIEVESDAASFRMTIENIPSDNPRTGRITAQSVVATLRRLNAPIRIGT